MPMMRRGPLDRYPPEWVLRQANAHEVGGSIEFHADRPATFYLDSGRIYAAEPGVAVREDLSDGSIPDEDEARAQVVNLLSDVLDTEGGWYYHDPLGQHPGRGSWVWETATLLLETRTRSHEMHTLSAWADRSIVLCDSPASAITLSADAWAVVVVLAEAASSTEVRARLGWTPGRLLPALAEIEDRGVMQPEPTWHRAAPVAWPVSTSASTRDPTMAAPSVGTDGHHTGPLAPPPVLPVPQTRRRKLPGRRTNGA